MVYAVMLAKVFNPEKHDPTSWLMSEKLDGVRAYWDGERFWSRGGKIYKAPDWFTNELPMNVHLDGELWLDRGEFNKASGIARKKEPTDEWADLTFLVFDAPQAEGGFEERMVIAEEALASKPRATYARVVDQEVCENIEHLQERMAAVLKLKGEGIMLRESGSPYIRSRSKHLLKVKKFYDAEAMVYDIQEGEGRHVGRMGALLVYWTPPKVESLMAHTDTPKYPDAASFKIGTGFSDDEREMFFEKDKNNNFVHIKKVVKFSYQEINRESGVPRFPVFLGVIE